MKKIIIFFICLLFHTGLSAFELDKNTISIQAKIYPQLIFFSVKAKELNQQKPLVIAAVYSEGGKKHAETFKEEVERIYPNGIKGYKLSVKIIPKDKLSKEKDFSASYVLFDDDDITQIPSNDELKNSITFAATKKVFVKNGAMFFVEITHKTSILLNKKTLLNSQISFDPSLLKMVKVYDE
jgi:hypothetical protein